MTINALVTDKNFKELCMLLFYLNNTKATFKIEKQEIRNYYFDAIKKYYIDLKFFVV